MTFELDRALREEHRQLLRPLDERHQYRSREQRLWKKAAIGVRLIR
jgi:hypothetical protein